MVTPTETTSGKINAYDDGVGRGHPSEEKIGFLPRLSRSPGLPPEVLPREAREGARSRSVLDRGEMVTSVVGPSVPTGLGLRYWHVRTALSVACDGGALRAAKL
jgi:hypothetical protein